MLLTCNATGVYQAGEACRGSCIAGNGKALYMKFPLDEEIVGAWWQQKVAHHQPSLHDEIPYLVLRVEKGRLYFDENIEHLPAQEFEVEQNEGAAFRWRFQPSGLVLELDSRCER